MKGPEMAARTFAVTRQAVTQAPEGVDVRARYRAIRQDGSATVLVADRKADRNTPDVRVRADKRITVRRAANSLAHRWGWTRDEVLAHYATEDSREVARGDLREAYLREQGLVRA